MRRFTFLAAILLAFQFLAPAGHAQQTAQMTWQFKSLHANIVDVKLFAKARGNQWPTTTTVWSLKDSEPHTVRITCQVNEQICYGAWVRGSNSAYWGVGKDGSAGCTNCCYRCVDGEVPLRTLNP